MSALSAFIAGLAIGAFVAGMLVWGWAQERIEDLRLTRTPPRFREE